MRFVPSLFVFLLLVQADSLAKNTVSFSAKTVFIPQAVDGTEIQYAYFLSVLHSIAELTEQEFGKVELVQVDIPMMQDRQLAALGGNGLDIVWSATSVDREKSYLPIRIPLCNNMFGYRVFFTSKEGIAKFSKNMSIEQIKQLIAVQGFDWPDTNILKQNGFNVTTSDYLTAFRLLKEQFVDYYPRGILEIENEQKTHAADGAYLEPHHVLYYPNFSYFFVRKDDHRLAARLTSGLNKMIANGELERLFKQQSFVIKAQQILKGRTIHKLKVELSEESAEIEKHLRRFMKAPIED